MLSTVYSAGLRGVDGYIVTVECDVRSRDEAFEIVGLPDAAVKVDKSCCAGVTPESHEAALTTMQMCQIDIIGA